MSLISVGKPSHATVPASVSTEPVTKPVWRETGTSQKQEKNINSSSAIFRSITDKFPSSLPRLIFI